MTVSWLRRLLGRKCGRVVGKRRNRKNHSGEAGLGMLGWDMTVGDGLVGLSMDLI